MTGYITAYQPRPPAFAGGSADRARLNPSKMIAHQQQHEQSDRDRDSDRERLRHLLRPIGSGGHREQSMPQTAYNHHEQQHYQELHESSASLDSASGGA